MSVGPRAQVKMPGRGTRESALDTSPRANRSVAVGPMGEGGAPGPRPGPEGAGCGCAHAAGNDGQASCEASAVAALTCPDTCAGRSARALPAVHVPDMPHSRPGSNRSSRTVLSSSVEAIILAGDVTAGDVIVLPDARDAVLVKQVRLGQGGFILTVVPADDDRPGAERLVTLTAGIRLRKTSR